MSDSLSRYDSPDDERPDDDRRPCKFETFSGECLHCGAGIDDECEIEREQRSAGRGR
jgi:hypothetical protein